MLTKPMLRILQLASLGQLPQCVDHDTPGINLRTFKELYRAGLIDAANVSADCGGAYLEAVLIFFGRAMHKSHE